jgi:hypothetical protein
MSPRDRRALVWGGVAVAAALLVLRGIPWGVDRFSTMRRTALDRQATLERAREVLDGGELVRDSLGRVVGAIMALAPKLVDGRSAADAQASLSSLVSLAAGRHSLKVLRLDPLPDSAAGVFSRVAVHAELEGDVSGVTRLLRGIETAMPLLSVRSLAISAPEPGPRGQPEALRVELGVAGYYLPRAAP